MNETPDMPQMSESPSPDEPKKNNQKLIIGIVVAVMLCCCCIVIAGLWTYGDQLVQGF